ncbi:MAG: MBL fold metallo-hydrolase [Candidatus Pacebacteria bacterium]|jgi:L-ascorbate metabolism protein UlaG (beta-lactamase superfamily)|nr:MBL fold metallo-hydrolase [Candidatus Paceibacterota bacterium]
MQIIWHGQSCFEIVIAKGKGESVSVLIDPLDEAKTGLKTSKTDSQIVLFTNESYTTRKLDKIAPQAFLVDGPGEYEIKGVYVRGIDFNFGKEAAERSSKTGTIYTIETEDMKLCHLGNIADAELTQGQVEKIGNIDVLMFPLGDGAKMGAKEALKIVSQIEPSIAIPMNYEIPKLELAAGNLKEFLKAAGVGEIEAAPKLTVKKKDIGPEEAKIVVLNP